jgi:hypothetical protein
MSKSRKEDWTKRVDKLVKKDVRREMNRRGPPVQQPARPIKSYTDTEFSVDGKKLAAQMHGGSGSLNAFHKAAMKRAFEPHCDKNVPVVVDPVETRELSSGGIIAQDSVATVVPPSFPHRGQLKSFKCTYMWELANSGAGFFYITPTGLWAVTNATPLHQNPTGAGTWTGALDQSAVGTNLYDLPNSGKFFSLPFAGDPMAYLYLLGGKITVSATSEALADQNVSFIMATHIMKTCTRSVILVWLDALESMWQN